MRELMSDRTGGGRGLPEQQHEVRRSKGATGAERLPTTNLGKSIAVVVATCYALVTFTGCALNRDYSVSANGVPLTARYVDAGQTRTDANPAQEERGWWANNWPYVLLAIVALGGIAAAVVLLKSDTKAATPGGSGGTL